MEPFPCQSLSADFPLTRTWQRTAESLSPRIEFSRAAPDSVIYDYTLRDAADTVIETGTAAIDTSTPGLDRPRAGGARPTHFGVYRIASGELFIDWDDIARPTDFADASTYQTE